VADAPGGGDDEGVLDGVLEADAEAAGAPWTPGRVFPKGE